MGFGDFDALCAQAAIPLCAVVGKITHIAGQQGLEADCYARNIEVANTIIFQGAASFMHIVALIMTVIMILHVRSKFTAVGRKEIAFFFYIYMMLTFASLIVDSGVVPPGSSTYPYFVALQNGFTSALCACLVVNGFIGFQVYEDGTALSVWLMRFVSASFFTITFLVSLATFKSWAGLGPAKTTGLFIVLYIGSAVALVIYGVSQVILVVNTLQDRWPLIDLFFGAGFLITGQVILYVFSTKICDAIEHYLDGLFFATICNLLAVMMVYKYWDSITREDLEFSVGTKQNNWEVKELLPEDDRRTTVYQDDYSGTMYNQPQHARNSNYGGFAY
ncbi:hypothetical protein QTJ16_000076 [Diplocarpon rosae]|uniref:Chitin synthase export chaperone n=1 Tax=Diplocarpon rosae TaxID=946125 RepID=A0AAD9T4A3_9HELO|nr:hypothetical protein QTJ16_000076 [Diplocarpon rosae]